MIFLSKKINMELNIFFSKNNSPWLKIFLVLIFFKLNTEDYNICTKYLGLYFKLIKLFNASAGFIFFWI